MTYRQFFIWLAVTTGLATVAAVVAHQLLDIGFATALTVTVILLLTALTGLLFFLGKRTAGAENKHLFGNIFMALTMLQMFLVGGTVAAFFVLGNPSNKLFVVPFFTSYLLYAVFQVVCLVILAGGVKPEAAQ